MAREIIISRYMNRYAGALRRAEMVAERYGVHVWNGNVGIAWFTSEERAQDYLSAILSNFPKADIVPVRAVGLVGVVPLGLGVLPPMWRSP